MTALTARSSENIPVSGRVAGRGIRDKRSPAIAPSLFPLGCSVSPHTLEQHRRPLLRLAAKAKKTRARGPRFVRCGERLACCGLCRPRHPTLNRG